MMRSKWLLATWYVFFVPACDSAPKPQDFVSKPDTVRQATPVIPTPTLSLEEGTFISGTVPGKFERDPPLEPAARKQRLGGYSIDRERWRDQGGTKARKVASADAAAQHCRSRKGRLCTELEWERACKGPESTPFSTGLEWKPDCAATGKCKTNHGMLAMGSSAEWTANEFGPGTPLAGRPVLRGAGSAGVSSARCASRRVPSQLPSRLFSFRCCYGPPNAARVEEGTLGKAYEFASISKERLISLLQEHPVTEALSTGARFFDAGSVGKILAAAQDDKKGFEFTTKPLLWNPTAGTKYLIILGTNDASDSFVLAYHVLTKDQFALSSSFVIRNDPGPFVLAYSESIRLRAHFTGCWGCAGETGKIIYRKPDRAVVVQP